jgi:hypothetical protein
MPRPRNYAAHASAAIHDLLASVTRLVDAARLAVANGRGPSRSARSPKARGGRTTKGAKISGAVKASWASYTPAERAARVRKMLAGRGLKPKRATKARRSPTKQRGRRTTSPRKATAPRKIVTARKPPANSWARLSPADRAARVAKMRVGRIAKHQRVAPTITNA